MSQDQWGPRYGDPTHPTTGELPRVGDGRTDEQRTIQVDTVAEAPPRQESRSRYRYSWESSETSDAEPAGGFSEPGHGFSEPRYAASEQHQGFSQPRSEAAAPSEPGFTNWSVPRVGRESSASGLTGEHSRPSLSGYRPGDTAQFARVGDGVRGSVGPVSVQIDHVRVDNGVNGDTQLLDTTNFKRPQETEIAPAEQAPQPEPGTGSMPAMRHQIGPDWTQTPLRLLAAAVVATAVLGASAASLITIGNWINP
ncbi:hypothetical protein [Glycomyces tritici]|uniref:Serine protease n=1 Tax=Glycomyces tritici TaxID=2665176 RepID=A0ABT7YNB6_9ACTN|nr:hypothetical protein [Glycomyces tritici]MDN3239899.1 hypothetical protein [Glycomyces tritici]